MKKYAKEIYVCDVCKSEYQVKEGGAGSAAFIAQKATETVFIIFLCPDCANEIYNKIKERSKNANRKIRT